MPAHRLPPSFFPQSNAPSPPALKLFLSPQTSDSTSDLTLTLREAYEKFLLPSLALQSPGTRQAYHQSLSAWERLTDNPPLGAISDDTTEAFRIAASQIPEISTATYNKYKRHLRSIFHRLAPRDTRNKKGKGILDFAPLLESIPEELGEPRVVSRGELSRMYRACSVARWPLVADAAQVWRTALVLLFNLGPRRCDLKDLDWSRVDVQRRTITFTAQKTGKKHLIPLHPVVYAHLCALPHRHGPLLPFTTCHRQLYREFQAIQRAAGIDHFYTLQDLRHTCGTAYDDLSPGLGEIILGHAPRGVFAKYYRNHGRRLRRAVKRLKQPQAFLSILLPEAWDPQRRLFD